MTYRKEINFNRNPLSVIIGIVLSIFVLLGLWFLAKFIFRLLFYLSPVMLVAALIIDRKAVTGYVQWIGRLYKKNTPFGIGVTFLSLIGIPIVSLFLLGKAFFRKKIKEVEQQRRNIEQGELIEYEELDSEQLQLPDVEAEPQKQKPRNQDTTYEDLFE